MHFLGIDTYMIRSDDISVYTTGDTIAAKKISDLKERVRIVNETENAMLISIHQNYYKDSRYSGAQVFYHADAALAKQLQSAFVDTLNAASRRKAKKGDGMYLLQNINCPAALIECGFLSNAQEEASLRTDVYQKKICCVIGCVVSCYIYNSVA
jgi:N-acetylmuramoyl-L-alanine amidase